MKKMRIAAATSLAAAAVVVGSALPAHAASFGPVYTAGGSYWYQDGTDTFCVRNSGVGKGISVTLNPSSRTRGPVLHVASFWDNEGSGATRCVSLARAYEDTRYTASVFSWNNGSRGTTYRSFYS